VKSIEREGLSEGLGKPEPLKQVDGIFLVLFEGGRFYGTI
jgi:hypothetical protein